MTAILSPADVRAIHQDQSEEIAQFLIGRMLAHPVETQNRFHWDAECGEHGEMNVLCESVYHSEDDSLDVSQTTGYDRDGCIVILSEALELLMRAGWSVTWEAAGSEFQVAHK